MFGFFPSIYAGMTIEEVMYDPEKMMNAFWQSLVEFELDMDQNPYGIRFLGPILESLDFKKP